MTNGAFHSGGRASEARLMPPYLRGWGGRRRLALKRSDSTTYKEQWIGSLRSMASLRKAFKTSYLRLKYFCHR